MLSQSLILLVLTGAAFASPQPQDATDRPRTGLGSTLERLPKSVGTRTIASYNIPTIPAFYSDFPTPLPLSVWDILATAIPYEEATKTGHLCEITDKAWYSGIPSNVKPLLVSYNSAANSWLLEHSSDLGDEFPTEVNECVTATNLKDTALPTGSETAEVTGFVTTFGDVVETGSAVSGTDSPRVTESSTVTSVVGGSSLSNGTEATRSVFSTVSPGSAPRVTNVVAGSLAGIVGALGVMVML